MSEEEPRAFKCPACDAPVEWLAKPNYIKLRRTCAPDCTAWFYYTFGEHRLDLPPGLKECELEIRTDDVAWRGFTS